MSSIHAGYELKRSGTGVLTIGKEIGYDTSHVDDYGFEIGPKELRVMLINPPVSFDVFYGEWDMSDVKSSSPPLGILSLASMIRKYGYEVRVLDAHAEGLTINQIVEEIRIFRPSVVGLTAMTVMISASAQIAKAIKEYDKSIITILGGVHVTAEPITTLQQYPQFDYGVVGEGEVVFMEYLEQIRLNKEIKRVQSLVWKEGEKINVNPRRQFFKSLDDFPPPAFDLVPNLFNHYRLSVFGTKKFKSVGLVTSRGCTGKCTFCLTADTLVLDTDLKWVRLDSITEGDYLFGIQEENDLGSYRKLISRTRVSKIYEHEDEVFEIKTDKGNVNATAEHPWLTGNNRWRATDQLKSGWKIAFFSKPEFYQKETIDYKEGYICGAIKSDGYFKRYIKKNGKIHHRCQIVGDHEMMETVLKFSSDLGLPLRKSKFDGGIYENITWKVSCYDEPTFWKIEEFFENKSPEFNRGFLAGFYDGDGSWTSALRFHGLNKETINDIKSRLKRYGFESNEIVSNGELIGLTLQGGMAEYIRFVSWSQPKVIRKHYKMLDHKTLRGSSEVISITPLGKRKVFNLETDCHTFIANGFVSHNCDLGVVGRGYRANSANYLISLMKDVYQKYDVTDFLFYDDLFVGSRPRLQEVCEMIINEKLPFTWSCCARVDFIHVDMLKLMKKAGCWMIEYGIESGCQRIIDSMRKNITKEKIRETINATSEADIVTKGNFIFGNPGETHDSIMESIDFACSLKLNYAQHTFLQPLPGSELYETAGLYGQFDPSWDRFNTFSINFIPKGFTRDNLVSYSKYFWRRFYLRPHILWQELMKIKRLEDVHRAWLAFKGFVKATIYKRKLPDFVLNRREVGLVH